VFHDTQHLDSAPNTNDARLTNTTNPTRLIPRQTRRDAQDRELAALMRRGGRKHHRGSWPMFWENAGRNTARAELESRPETPAVLAGVLCDSAGQR